MYKQYFGLEHEPFRITPDTQSFFTGGDRGAILRALVYAICDGDAIIKLVGEVGSGKTMLCRMLEQYLPQNIDIAYIANPRLSPDNILQTIAFELDLPLTTLQCNNRVLMMGALQNYLLAAHAQGRQVVVLVEEAQSIPIETLEEIRLLSNLETSQHKLLQIVLFGQPELDEILERKSIRQIKERIANNFYLLPLNKNDVVEYIQFRLHAAGHRGSQILSPAATKLIWRFSRGLLRKINILSDKALLAAWQNESPVVKRNHVVKASQDFMITTKKRVTKAMLYASAFSLALTLGAGLLWNTVTEQQNKITELNKLPSTHAGINTSKAKAVPLPTHQRKTNLQPSQNLKSTEEPNASPRNSAVKKTTVYQKQLLRSRQWLNGVNPSHYTIQVLLTNADANDELLKKLSEEFDNSTLEQLQFVRTNIMGNPMLKVLYGEYASYTEARKALQTLPASLRQHQPYIRNIGSVNSTAISKIKSRDTEL